MPWRAGPQPLPRYIVCALSSIGDSAGYITLHQGCRDRAAHFAAYENVVPSLSSCHLDFYTLSNSVVSTVISPLSLSLPPSQTKLIWQVTGLMASRTTQSWPSRSPLSWVRGRAAGGSARQATARGPPDLLRRGNKGSLDL